MIISRVTITGADDFTDPWEMHEITREFPFVEWGILFSETRTGTPRYPTEQWLAKFTRICAKAQKAAHLCGSFYIEGFLTHKIEIEGFDRIQLNFNAKRLNKELRERLSRRIKEQAPIKVITQHNQSNADIWSMLRDVRNHQVLFDGSGGRGHSPEEWEEPLPGVKCGYAGGLRPENLEKELNRIYEVAKRDTIWIDMESGVRDEHDRLDMEKVRECLKIVSKHSLVDLSLRKTPEPETPQPTPPTENP